MVKRPTLQEKHHYFLSRFMYRYIHGKLKIHELKSTKISNDAFCLDELLHLYICESRIQKTKHYDLNLQNLRNFKINHAFLKFLCTFLYLKIRNIERVITIGCFDSFLKEISFCSTSYIGRSHF